MRLIPRFGNSNALLVSFFLAPVLPAQVPRASALPANASTTAETASSAMPEAHSTQVTYTDGVLTVKSDGAGLNGIIREIARQTDMRVSGSVADVPVFGTYGPSTRAKILSTLLDGTGSNILFVESTAGGPAQLTLTRRTGSATPPNPNAQAEETTAEDSRNNQNFGRPVQLPVRSGIGYSGQNAGNGPQSPQAAPSTNASQSSTTEQQVAFPPAGPTGTPSTGTTTPVDGDPASTGIKTPQQIFEQLQRMRQQQQQNSNQP